jgi:hypothetical protein
LKDLTERFDAAERQRASDGSVDVVQLSKQMENSMRKLENQMSSHTKRMVIFETNATDSLT